MDNHSTTRVDPRVVESMLPYFSEDYGNAASITHSYGAEAAQAVEAARAQIAQLLGTGPKTIAFTSGATESNNLAIKGLLWASKQGSHLIVTAAEHKAVLDPAAALEPDGYSLTILPVDRFGAVNPEQVAGAIRPNTVLVSVMFANNEVGTVNPVEEIGRICRERGVCFHTDATQAAGKIPINLSELPVDLAERLRAQDVRTEGNWSTLRPPYLSTDQNMSAARRRRPRAGAAKRNATRSPDRRLWRCVCVMPADSGQRKPTAN